MLQRRFPVEPNGQSLGEAFLEQQARLRVALGHGKEIGPAGRFYCAVIEDLLRRADRAAMEQDTVAMLALYEEMKAIKE